MRGRGRRAWTAAVAWPLAAGAVFFAGVRGLGVAWETPLVQLIAFTPYLALCCLLAAVPAGLSRRPIATGLAALAAVVLAAPVLPRALGSPATGGGTPLVVASVNMRYGGADARSIVELVRAAEVDVLALQEFTPAAERALLDAGLGQALPYRQSHPADLAIGSAVYARLPLSDGGVRSVSDRAVVATLLIPCGRNGQSAGC